MKRSITLIALALCLPTFAEITVTMLKGNVLYNKKPLKEKSTIKKPGIISTGQSAFCMLSFNGGTSRVVVGPNSSYEIHEVKSSKESSSTTLNKGSLRYHTLGNTNATKPIIRTKQVSLGVRGTDFLLITAPLLEETEIVMFDGLVRMTNQNQPKEYLDVKEGQWGGLGGRFGQKFQKPIDLPANVLKVFSDKIPK